MSADEKVLESNGVETKEEEKPIEKRFSKDEVQEIIQQRLRQETAASQKREAELRAKLEELQQQKMGAAPDAMQAQGAAGNVDDHETERKVLEKYMPYLMEEQKQRATQEEFSKKINEAVEKDPEFKTLAQNGNPIAGEMIARMTHLDNAPAVLKQLLKSKKEHAVMVAKWQEGPGEFTRYVNSLSDQLENSIKKPGPSDYQPLPDVTDGSESGQDFDLESYVKGKI